MGDLPAKMGPYRIVRQLGEGGMGTVLEAVHEGIHRRVAIKLLRPELARDPDMANRFINEARAVNLVEHPGLVQISDFGRLPDGTSYIVMEFLRGDTLETRLTRCGGKLSVAQVLHLGWQLADSLAAAHAKGIIHRDLKPSNVMMVADPHMQIGERTKVLDFGLVKLTEARGGLHVKTHSNAVIGTPLYMSPEQCEGPTRVDDKTDVYSLGVMLYEMLAGRVPFLGESLGQIIAMHLFKEPEPLGQVEPSVPSPLVELIHRTLAKDKEQRPSMQETAQALESMFGLAPAPPRRAADSHQDNSGDSALAVGLAATLGQSSQEQPSLDSSADRSTAAEKNRIVGLASTLGQAAAQGRGAPALARRRWLVGSVAGLVAAGLAGWLVLRNRPAISVAPEKLGQVSVKRITIGVETDPPGAEVIANGQLLGKTPWNSERVAQPGVMKVQLRLAGYVDRDILLDLSTGGIRLMALVPAPPAQPAGEPTPAVTAAPSKGAKHVKQRKSEKADPLSGKTSRKPEHGTLPIEY